VETTISTLKSRGLVDDMAFARYWRESRDSGHPRSRAALKSELARKGIDPEVAAQALDGVDDEAAAYRAVEKKAARLGRSDRKEFRSKLAAALRRRGFSYEVIEHTVNRVWQESRING
jgi:regulatory protein